MESDLNEISAFSAPDRHPDQRHLHLHPHYRSWLIQNPRPIVIGFLDVARDVLFPLFLNFDAVVGVWTLVKGYIRVTASALEGHQAVEYPFHGGGQTRPVIGVAALADRFGCGRIRMDHIRQFAESPLTLYAIDQFFETSGIKFHLCVSIRLICYGVLLFLLMDEH